jgi:hypothetical protein
MALIVCERKFSSPISLQQFGAAGEALGPCLDVRGIRWIGSAFSADGTKSVCRFEAADAESVRQANREAGCPFEHVWAAQELSP